MLPVLDLDPVFRSTGAVGPISALRHNALKLHLARGLEQVRSDLALLEGRDEDSVCAAAQVLAIQRQNVEGTF